MSILKTFLILFKGDASQAIQEEEKLTKSTKKTTAEITALGKVTDVAKNNFIGLGNSFIGALTAAAGFGAIVAGFRNAANYANELSLASRQLNIPVDQLDAWIGAVKTAGGNAQSFESTLRGLSERFGVTGAQALKLLPVLADNFQKLGKIRSQQYGKLIGIDESTILLLQHGRREVEEVLRTQRELGVITQKNADAYNHFDIQLGNTGRSFRSLFSELGVMALPALEKFLDVTTKIIHFIGQHKDVVVGSFLAIGAAVVYMTAPLLITYGIIISLIAAFGLLFDDIKTFVNGGDSLFGRVVGGEKPDFPFLPGGTEKSFKYFVHGKKALDEANSSPLNSYSSNSVLNQTAFSRNQEINVGGVTIHTQATDAPGIAKGFTKSLTDHFWQANNYFADGVQI